MGIKPGIGTAGRRRLVVVLIAAVAALAIAACGSSSSSSSSSTSGATSGQNSADSTSSGAVAQAQSMVSQFLKQPTVIPVTAPIKKPIPQNKKIDFMTCQSQGCVTIANGFKQAAAILHWQVKVLTVTATANAIQVAYDEALRDQPSGIVTVGISSTGVAAQDQKLIAAHIPVVAVQDPDEPHPPYVASLLNHNTSVPQGKDMAALAVSKGCTGKLLYFQLGGFIVLKYDLQGFQQEFAQLAPKGSIQVVNVPVTSLANAAPIVVGAARSNPDAKCVVLSQDDMAIGLPQALKAAGISGLKVIDLGPASSITDQYFKNGQIDAIVIPPALGDWGFLMADALARSFTGQSAAPDTQAVLVPWITSGSSIPPVSQFAEVANTPQQYKKLWNIGG